MWIKLCYSCLFHRSLLFHTSRLIIYKDFSNTYGGFSKGIISYLNSNLTHKDINPGVRLCYSTNFENLKQNNENTATESAKPKKKKEIKTYITLLDSANNISVTTVEEASKLASRRNFKLVKVKEIDPKTNRPVYQLMTESQYLKTDTEWNLSKGKKEKGNFIKGNKVVSLSSSTNENDILTKVKMMKKWLEKRYEVRVVITGDQKTGENVYKVIEKEIASDGRIVQKRNKGQDIRFQIIPPKETQEATANN